MFGRLKRLTFSTLCHLQGKKGLSSIRISVRLLDGNGLLYVPAYKKVRHAFRFCSDSFRIVQESLSVCRSDSSALE